MIDIKEVKYKWEELRKRANESYTYGDADNFHIAIFDEWLNAEVLLDETEDKA